MHTERTDIRNFEPSEDHRRVFLGGWTDAVNGKLYTTVLNRKTHANMGNLFGWIYGDQSREFKLAVWYQYCDATLRDNKKSNG